jgi:hypothetical protein
MATTVHHHADGIDITAPSWGSLRNLIAELRLTNAALKIAAGRPAPSRAARILAQGSLAILAHGPSITIMDTRSGALMTTSHEAARTAWPALWRNLDAPRITPPHKELRVRQDTLVCNKTPRPCEQHERK